MQIIRRLQSSQPFDCFSINWKWIFSLCCSFPEGPTTKSVTPVEEKYLLTSTKEEVYHAINLTKKWSDGLSIDTSSIAPTEEEEKKNWRDFEDFEPDEIGIVAEDQETIAAIRGLEEECKKDDDNRSDASDERIKKLGEVVAKFKYEMMKNTLSVDILRVNYLPSKTSGGPSAYQIYVKIFDVNGRALVKWHSPMFEAGRFPKEQVVEYSDMSARDISSTAVRMRLYGCERKRRDKLLSESIVGLASVNLRKHEEYKIKLEQRAEIKLITNTEIEMAEDYSSKVKIIVEEAVGKQPELFVGLAYNQVTGRITVEIVKGNAFKNPLVRGEEKLPNSFVRITICAASSQEIAKSKTTVRYNQANPLFKEKFMFQVSQHQLNEVSVMIAVYHKKSSHKKEIIGWFSLGLNSSSTEEFSHWQAMIVARGEMSSQWHLLQDNSKSRHGLPGAD